MLEPALAIITGYLLGSVPFAYIAGRLIKRVDIGQVGGGNIGATNVMREVGTAAGIGVLLADMAKGALAVMIAQQLSPSLVITFIAGFAAVVGHNWSVFLKFQGGMGAATTIGVFFALVPIPCAISFAVMVLVILPTSNIRLGIGVGYVFLPFIIWGFGGEPSLIIYSVALPLFTALRLIPEVKKISPEERKGLIFDREHTWWQRKRK